LGRNPWLKSSNEKVRRKGNGQVWKFDLEVFSPGKISDISSHKREENRRGNGDYELVYSWHLKWKIPYKNAIDGAYIPEEDKIR